MASCLSPADVVPNLGVLFDSKFCFTDQVNSVTKFCFANLCDFHRIRHFLSFDVSLMVTNALVSSHLDYCNSLFHSLSSKNITRLQNIPNCFVTGQWCFKIYPHYSNPQISSLASHETTNHLQNLGTHIQVPYNWEANIFCPMSASVYNYLLLKQEVAIQRRCPSRFLIIVPHS